MLYLGIDLHGKQFTVCLRDDAGSVAMRRQVTTSTDASAINENRYRLTIATEVATGSRIASDHGVAVIDVDLKFDDAGNSRASHCSAFVPGSMIRGATDDRRLLISAIRARTSCPTASDICCRTRRTSL